MWLAIKAFKFRKVSTFSGKAGDKEHFKQVKVRHLHRKTGYRKSFHTHKIDKVGEGKGCRERT